MTPADFLRAMWPDSGYYCIATPFTIPGTDKRVYGHKVFKSITEAADFVDSIKMSKDVFYAVHTLREERVWNPSKVDRKTGEQGAYEVRTQANARSVKCFFFDLDVGSVDGKYASQAAALAGLKDFCTTTGLPRPTIASSGGGLHVYWRLTKPMESAEWRTEAAKLRQLAKHHGLLADPTRTTDTASVLRVVGTFNWKNPDEPRKVKLLADGHAMAPDAIIKLMDNAIIRGGVSVPAAPASSAMPDYMRDLESNLSGDEFSGPPVSMAALITACAQMQRQARLKGNVPEPEWYHTINLVRFVERGDEMVHRISAGHPGYDKDETNQKLEHLRAKNIQPTSCATMERICAGNLCDGCPAKGRVKSPIVAARFKDKKQQPVVTQQVGSITVTTTIPDPPKPYTRLKSGGVAAKMKNADGDEVEHIIYDHDLYPVRRITSLAEAREQQEWRVELPRSGAKDFVLDADALYDRRKFVVAVSNQGIYPKPASVQELQDYMVAYISELQRLADAEAQNDHLGWNSDQSEFILPDKVLLPDGTAKRATLSLGAARSSAHVSQSGTLARQVELMSFYDNPGYVAHQFFLTMGLAAPIFYATGQHGAIANASGAPGASKSTALYTAASFWGNPARYPINGTSDGSTRLARQNRMNILANLPICVDEITHLGLDEAKNLALSVSQPNGRIGLERSGVERASMDNLKSTIMLCTANNSLHALLASDNAASTAGSMRVFEMRFSNTGVHKKFEADEYLIELSQNYGFIGEQFMAHVLKNKSAIEEQVRAEMKAVDTDASIQPSERFWSAVVATTLVAGRVAHGLGLLPFDVEAQRRWALNEQLPAMRGQVVMEYATPLAMLTDYLQSINGNTIVMSKPHTGNIPFVLKQPHGQLLAHYDVPNKMMYVLRKGFVDFCARSGANANSILSDLHALRPTANGPSRIVPAPRTRRVLGAGSEYATSQSWCFAINMADPEVSGVADLAVVAQDAVVGKKVG